MSMEKLIMAIFKKNEDEVDEILKSFPDIEARYTPKSNNMDKVLTPLQFAAGVGKVEIINKLLAKKADRNAKSEYGRNALSIAAYWGNIEACKLLQSETDLLSKDSRGLTPYDNAGFAITNVKSEDQKARCRQVEAILCLPTFLAALRKPDDNVARIIAREKKLDLEKLFVDACRDGDYVVVSKMLALKLVDINCYSDGFTGLHVACMNAHKYVVFELLSKRELEVNATVKNAGGMSGEIALHCVCITHSGLPLTYSTSKDSDELSIRVDIAEQLINHGADLNHVGNRGYYPVNAAIVYNELEVVKLFIMRGTNPELRVKISEEIRRKNNYPHEYMDLTELSIVNRPAIYSFLTQVIKGQYSFDITETIGGGVRVNFSRPNCKHQPKKFYEWEEERNSTSSIRA